MAKRKQTPKQVAESRYRNILMSALDRDAEEHASEHLIEHAVKEARTDNTLLSALLRKLLPDLKAIEAKIDSESPYRLIIELPRPVVNKVGSKQVVKLSKSKTDKQQRP